MTTASPSPTVVTPTSPVANGTHGRCVIAPAPTSMKRTTGASVAAASTTAARPVGRTPSTFSAVSATMNETASNHRSSVVIAGYQNRTYSTKSAG